MVVQILFGQSIERSVISSFGESVNSSGITYSHVAGEPITQTYLNASNNLIVTQGFLQPEKQDLNSLNEWDASGDFNIFPNPFNESFTVSSGSAKLVFLKLFDESGRLIYQSPSAMDLTQAAYTFHTANLAAGVYVVSVSSKQNTKQQTHKLIKIK